MGSAHSSPGVPPSPEAEATIATLDASLEESTRLLRSAKEEAPPVAAGDFYDRKEEAIELIDILGAKPLRVIFLVGPVDSGKSALLSHLQEIWMTKSDARKLLSPFLLINMRKKECGSPDELAVAIRSELESWQKVAKAALKGVGTMLGVPFGPMATALSEFTQALSSTSTGLGAIQDTIRLYLDKHRSVRPVIVMDEANMIQSWEGKYDTELTSLLQFVLWITKETRRGHVVMASSDEFFRSWIRTKLLSTRQLVVGLGYFAPAEAKGFVLKRLLISHTDTTLLADFEAAWKDIHAVAGGSPMQLQAVVEDARRFGSWKTAVQSMLQGAEGDLEVGRMLEGDAFQIMRLVVQCGVAVGFSEVQNTVFNRSFKAAAESVADLVRRNLIHVRVAYAGMKYKDISLPDGDEKEFLMATSPAALAAMKSLVAKYQA